MYMSVKHIKRFVQFKIKKDTKHKNIVLGFFFVFSYAQQ